MSFEIYRNQTKERSYSRKAREIGDPKLTISKRGVGNFNQDAVLKYSINDYKYITILFDEKKQQIALRFIKNRTLKSSKKLARGNAVTNFSMIGFLKYHDIDFTHTKTYVINYNEVSKLYIIQLEE